jgi:hypothetical protein
MSPLDDAFIFSILILIIIGWWGQFKRDKIEEGKLRDAFKPGYKYGIYADHEDEDSYIRRINTPPDDEVNTWFGGQL